MADGRPGAELASRFRVDTYRGREEEREEPRYPVRIRASLLVQGRSIELSSENVSRRGIFFRSSDPVRPRQLVRIRLQLPPHDEVVVAPAMIAHADPGGGGEAAPGFGVRFVGFDGEPLEAWLRFLRLLEGPAGAASEDALALEHGEIADYAVHPPTVEDLEALIAEELARGRVVVPTYAAASVGAKVFVHVVHPVTEDTFPLAGTVVRFDPGGRGLALVELVPPTDEVRRALQDFVHGIHIVEPSFRDLADAEGGAGASESEDGATPASDPGAETIDAPPTARAG